MFKQKWSRLVAVMGGLSTAVWATGSALAVSVGVGITITGTVLTIVFIEITESGNTFNIEQTTQQTADRIIGSVRHWSNDAAGYTIRVASTNITAGRCTTAGKSCLWRSGSTDNFSIDVESQAGANMDFTGNTPTWYTRVDKPSGIQGPHNIVINFDILAADVPQGTYTETLTFTISSNT